MNLLLYNTPRHYGGTERRRMRSEMGRGWLPEAAAAETHGQFKLTLPAQFVLIAWFCLVRVSPQPTMKGG
jgi:hypothetical protein